MGWRSPRVQGLAAPVAGAPALPRPPPNSAAATRALAAVGVHPQNSAHRASPGQPHLRVRVVVLAPQLQARELRQRGQAEGRGGGAHAVQRQRAQATQGGHKLQAGGRLGLLALPGVRVVDEERAQGGEALDAWPPGAQRRPGQLQQREAGKGAAAAAAAVAAAVKMAGAESSVWLFASSLCCAP